jgi:hypothetical protein
MITRSSIKKAKSKTAGFLRKEQKLGKRSRFYKITRFVLRTDNFSIKYNDGIIALNNVNFIYDPINKHWAETDGDSITLNTYKNYTVRTLTNTLKHEVLHNIILRDYRHYIPEEKEHKIMELFKPTLISAKYRGYT